MGQVYVLVDKLGHVLLTMDVGGVAKRNAEESDIASNHETKLLKRTKDNFMTIIFNTVGRREQELNTSLWVRMYVQKTVIHIIFYKKNNMNQMTKFVLNEETLAPHINSNLDSNKLIQLWDNKKSMTKFLKNCLFEVK